MYTIEIPCILDTDLMWPPIIRTEYFKESQVKEWKARCKELLELGYNIASFWDPDLVVDDSRLVRFENGKMRYEDGTPAGLKDEYV